MRLEFSGQIFGKKLKYQVLSKSVQWEASYSMRTDWERGMTKLIVAFLNSANAPKNPVASLYYSDFPIVFSYMLSRLSTQMCKRLM